MSLVDWTVMDGSLDGTNWVGTIVKRGVTSGISGPPGSTHFVFGFNSTQITDGAVAISCSIANFGPIEPRPVHSGSGGGGGSIRGCVKRGQSAGKTGFSPFLFIGANLNDVQATTYMLGLEDADPNRIVLVKGQIQHGVPSVDAPGTQTVLRCSQNVYDWDKWHHLRLDMIVNDNGDVVLYAYENDLDTNNCNAPVWTPIEFNDGLEYPDGVYVDDSLGVMTESDPLLSGYLGFGFEVSNSARRGYFDHMEVMRQKAP